MNSLQSRPLFEISIDLHPIQEIGSTPAGERRVIPVAGGRFNGERINGVVLPHAGSDLLLMRADGSFQQDVRLVLPIRRRRPDPHDLSRSAAQPTGGRRRLARGEAVPRTDYYLRIAPFFETAASGYEWLNRIVAIGVGRTPAEWSCL